MSGHGVPHHAENAAQKRIGIFIALLAVVMAVVAALATQQANEMIVKEIKSSNSFAWYQAKRQRSYVNELEIKRMEMELAGTPTEGQRKLFESQAARLTAKNSEYETENKDILRGAEQDRDEADVAGHKHHRFEYSEIALHIAVVLCSLVLLTEQAMFFRLGIVATLIGVGLAGMAFVPHSSHSEHAEHASSAVPSEHSISTSPSHEEKAK
jgi:hypothetical protein